MKLLLIPFVLTYAFAAPAFNKEREFTQADGTKFTARAHGDHHLNWIETTDGELLRYNSQTKNFEYAEIKDDRLKASGQRYEKNSLKKAKSFKNTNKLLKDDVYELWRKKRSKSY